MKYRISTEHNLSNLDLKTHLENILNILLKNNIETVKILFGFAWGNEFNNWPEMKLAIKDIVPIINLVENQKYGKIGEDDFICRFRAGNFYCEFNVCHHAGIDWEFINENAQSTLFSSLLNYFKSAFKEPSCDREVIQDPSRKWEPYNLMEFQV
jgi:hypothetical protein